MTANLSHFHVAQHEIRALESRCFCGQPVDSRALQMCATHAEIVMSDVENLGRGTYKETK